MLNHLNVVTPVDMFGSATEMKKTLAKAFPEALFPIDSFFRSLTIAQLREFDDPSFQAKDDLFRESHYHYHHRGLYAGQMDASIDKQFSVRGVERSVVCNYDAMRTAYFKYLLEGLDIIDMETFTDMLARSTLTPTRGDVRQIIDWLLAHIAENIDVAPLLVLTSLRTHMSAEQLSSYSTLRERISYRLDRSDCGGLFDQFEASLEDDDIEDFNWRPIAMGTKYDEQVGSAFITPLSHCPPCATPPSEVCVVLQGIQVLGSGPMCPILSSEQRLKLSGAQHLSSVAQKSPFAVLWEGYEGTQESLQYHQFRINGQLKTISHLEALIPSELDKFIKGAHLSHFETFDYRANRANLLSLSSPSTSISLDRRVNLALCMISYGLGDVTDLLMYYMHSSDPLVIGLKEEVDSRAFRLSHMLDVDPEALSNEAACFRSFKIEMQVSSYDMSAAVQGFRQRCVQAQTINPCWPIPRDYGFFSGGGQWYTPGDRLRSNDVCFYMRAPNTAKCRLTVDEPGALSDNMNVDVPMYRLTGDYVAYDSQHPIIVPPAWFGIRVDPHFVFQINVLYWFTVYDSCNVYGSVPFFVSRQVIHNKMLVHPPRSVRSVETWTDLPLPPWPETWDTLADDGEVDHDWADDSDDD